LRRIGNRRPKKLFPVLLCDVRQLRELELRRFEPGFVGMLGGEFALDLVVLDDATLF